MMQDLIKWARQHANISHDSPDLIVGSYNDKVFRLSFGLASLSVVVLKAGQSLSVVIGVSTSFHVIRPITSPKLKYHYIMARYCRLPSYTFIVFSGFVMDNG
jgi:hypothetical protein